MAIKVGDRAPEFTLKTDSGEEFSLKEEIGKKAIVLFFYPKDFTPICTAEVCAFRDAYETFVTAGALVVGISSDNENSHAKFRSEHKLPFVLLTDDSDGVRKKYGATSMMGLLPGRVTYVIDKKGIVRLAFSSQLSADGHVKEALAIVETLTRAQ